MTAFHGNAGAKYELIQYYKGAIEDPALAERAKADRIFQGPILWTVGEDSEELFAKRTGFPEALVKPISTLASFHGDEAKDLGLAWLTAPAPGADLSAVPQAMVLEALEQDDLRQMLCATPAGERVYDRLIAMHRSEAAGDPIPPAEWRAARKEAVALLNEVSDDKRKLEILEIIAWPVRSAEELPMALLLAEIRCRFAFEMDRRGLSDFAQGDLREKLMRARINEGLSQTDAKAAVDAELEASFPEVIEWERSRGEISRSVPGAVARATAQRMTRLIKAAAA